MIKNSKTKKKQPIKKKQEKKKETKDLNSILNQEEINSLKKIVKQEDGNLNPISIQDILKNQKIKSSPSLEKINSLQEVSIRIDRNIITGNMSVDVKDNKMYGDKKESGYSQKDSEQEDKKYTSIYGENIAKLVNKNDARISGPRGETEPRKIAFNQQSEVKSQGQDNFKKYSTFIPIERADTIGKKKKNIFGIENSFEVTEIKYEGSGY